MSSWVQRCVQYQTNTVAIATSEQILIFTCHNVCFSLALIKQSKLLKITGLWWLTLTHTDGSWLFQHTCQLHFSLTHACHQHVKSVRVGETKWMLRLWESLRRCATLAFLMSARTAWLSKMRSVGVFHPSV